MLISRSLTVRLITFHSLISLISLIAISMPSYCRRRYRSLLKKKKRYEGESIPDVAGMPNCMSHCSSAEALADYAALVPLIKADYNATNSPVISFGGSYGGTSKQSTWFCGRAPQERSASSNLHKDKTHSTQLFLLFLFFSFLFPFSFPLFLIHFSDQI